MILVLTKPSEQAKWQPMGRISKEEQGSTCYLNHKESDKFANGRQHNNAGSNGKLRCFLVVGQAATSTTSPPLAMARASRITLLLQTTLVQMPEEVMMNVLMLGQSLPWENQEEVLEAIMPTCCWHAMTLINGRSTSIFVLVWEMLLVDWLREPCLKTCQTWCSIDMAWRMLQRDQRGRGEGRLLAPPLHPSKMINVANALCVLVRGRRGSVEEVVLVVMCNNV